MASPNKNLTGISFEFRAKSIVIAIYSLEPYVVVFIHLAGVNFWLSALVSLPIHSPLQLNIPITILFLNLVWFVQ